MSNRLVSLFFSLDFDYLPFPYPDVMHVFIGSLGSMEVCMDNDSGCAGMGSTLTLKSGASYSPAVDHQVPFPYHHPGNESMQL